MKHPQINLRTVAKADIAEGTLLIMWEHHRGELTYQTRDMNGRATTRTPEIMARRSLRAVRERHAQ